MFKIVEIEKGQFFIAEQDGSVPAWYEKPFPFNMLWPDRGDSFATKEAAALALYEFNEAYGCVGDSYNKPENHPSYYQAA